MIEDSNRFYPKRPQTVPIHPKPTSKLWLYLIILAVVIILLGVFFFSGFSTGDRKVEVSYSGKWSGAIVDDSGSRSVDGSGYKTFNTKGTTSVTFQKTDDGSGTLIVKIIKNGKVIASQSTSAQYGVVSVVG